MVRIGLMGASRIARKIFPAIRSTEGVSIRGVAASDAQRAADFAKEFGIAAFESYDACLQAADVDAVYISVLNSDHARLIMAALASGKHVLCEKPLVLTAADARAAFALAASRKLVLLEGLMYRHHPQIRRMLAIVASGAIGTVKSVRADFSFVLETHGTARRTRKGGGGAVADVGCYAIDFANLAAGAGREGRLVHLSHERDVGVPAPEAVERSVSAIIDYPGGVRATICAGIDSPSVNRWEICGDKGAIAALRCDPQGAEPAQLFRLDEDSVVQVERVEVPGGGLRQFVAEFENFRDAILGKDAPEVTAEQSIRNATLVDEMRKLTSR